MDYAHDSQAKCTSGRFRSRANNLFVYCKPTGKDRSAKRVNLDPVEPHPHRTYVHKAFGGGAEECTLCTVSVIS